MIWETMFSEKTFDYIAYIDHILWVTYSNSTKLNVEEYYS